MMPYDAEGHRQLSDGPVYERLDQDPVKEYQQIIKTTVNEMIHANELPPSAKRTTLGDRLFRVQLSY